MNQVSIMDPENPGLCLCYFVELNGQNIVALKKGIIVWNVNPITQKIQGRGDMHIADEMSPEKGSDRLHVWWTNGMFASIDKKTGESIVFGN